MANVSPDTSCPSLFLSFSSFLVLLTSISAVQISPKQVNPLLALKRSLDPSSSFLQSWGRGGNCGRMLGISCDSKTGAVTRIELSNVGLNGTIPESLWLLTEVEFIDLSTNFLTGRIPEKLVNLALLSSLNLNGNNLTGPIPENIGRLSRLTSLNLGVNFLNGPIPSSIGSLSSLQFLSLEKNNLQGPIPTTIGSLSALTSLALNTNKLNGSIPPSMTFLSKLSNLDLHYNELSGPLPQGLGNLRSLQSIVLSSNMLTGELSDEIAKWSSITSIDLSLNNLTGTLPESIGQLSTLQFLNLYYNSFSGPLPSSLTKCTNLINLRIGLNNFSGSLPENIGDLSSLMYFYAYGNSFSGPIPKSLGQMASLLHLDLSVNNFSGEIPDVLSGLYLIIELGLADNSLSGRIPASLSLVSSLLYIDLHDNQLEGPLPKGFEGMVNLQIVDFSRNNLTGRVPELTKLVNLYSISLYGNQFRGPLPSLPYSMINVNFGSNRFSGSFPLSYTLLGNITIMQISGCQLSGDLPSDFSKMDKLSKIDCSSNSLSGPLPSSFPESLLAIDLRANKLQGSFATSKLSIKNLPRLNSIDMSRNQLSGTVPTFASRALSFLILNDNLFQSVDDALVTETSSSLTISLVNNPWCQSSTNQLLPFCSVQPKSYYQFRSPDLCTPASLSCPPNQAPNPNLFFSGNKLCQCSEYASAMLLLLSPSFDFLNAELAGELITLVAAYLVDNYNNPIIQVNQIRLYSGVREDGGMQSVILQFFTLDGEPWEPFDIGSVFVTLYDLSKYNGELSPEFGSYVVLDKGEDVYGKLYGNATSVPSPISEAPATVIPFPGNSSKSRNGSSSSLAVILAVGAVVAVLLLVSGLFFAHAKARKRKEEADNLVASLSDFQVSVHSHFVPSVPLSAILRATNHFGADHLLGEGGHGSVYMGVGADGHVWAIKRSKLITKRGLQLLQNEIDSLSKVSHRNLVKLLGFCDESNEQILIYEFVTNGNLQEHLRPTKRKRNEDKSSGSSSEKRPNATIRASSLSNNAQPLDSAATPQITTTETNSTRKSGSYSSSPLVTKASEPKSPKKRVSFGIASFRSRSRDGSSASDDNKSTLRNNAAAPSPAAAVLLPRREFPPLSFEHRLRIAIGTAEGLHYLHSFANPGIIHRDVKSENILLTDKLEAKLADFGLLKSLKDEDRSEALSTRVAGTPGYMDPEYYKTFKVTTKSDVYSFGVVLLELITGRPPAMDHNSTTEQTFPAHSKIPTSQEPKQFITISEWAFPLIANGEMEALADPKLGQDYPREALRKMAFVALQCIQRSSADRPDMGDVVLMLKDIEAEVMGKKLTQHHAMPVDGDYAGVPMQNFSSTNCGETVDASAPMSVMLVGR